MNERIKELAEQASLYARSDNSSMLFENYHNRYTDKFAELIVKECIEAIQNESMNYLSELTERGLRIAEGAILDHFGVEE